MKWLQDILDGNAHDLVLVFTSGVGYDFDQESPVFPKRTSRSMTDFFPDFAILARLEQSCAPVANTGFQLLATWSLS